MLDVRRMRVLREVGRRGSFSAAAEALSFTQSAVSQQIAALERETASTLVERGARGVRLTEAGEVLARHADVVLARLDDAQAELDALAGLKGGRVRLAAFPSAGASIMPRAIARFRELHPAVELTLEPSEPDDGLAGLRAGDFDIAVTVQTAWDRQGDDGLARLHLLDDPMSVCLREDHPLARKARVKLADLAEEPWLLGSRGTCPDTSIFLRACATAGFEANAAFHSDDYNAIQGFVAAGMGVALMPHLAIVTIREDVVIRSIAPPTPFRRIVAATLEDGYRSPAIEAMLEILVEVGAEFAAVERPELTLAG
jgi:DNA-binding transcriptional LysR family regulator